MPLPYKYLYPHNQIISRQYAANVHLSLSSIYIVQKAAKSHQCFVVEVAILLAVIYLQIKSQHGYILL